MVKFTLSLAVLLVTSLGFTQKSSGKDQYKTDTTILFQKEEKPVAKLLNEEMTFSLLVYRDGANVGENCILELYRNNKIEKIRAITEDSTKYIVFQFKAKKDDLIKAGIRHKELGIMNTTLKCFYHHIGANFIAPNEPYYYTNLGKTLFVSDSSKYRVHGLRQWPQADSVFQFITATGIPFKRTSWDEIQTDKQDAVKLEQLLLKSHWGSHLEPKMICEKNDPTYLTTVSSITFKDGVTDEWIVGQFKRLGISMYYKNSSGYGKVRYYYEVQFIHGADQGYLKILDELWEMKEVQNIVQEHVTLYHED